MGGMKERVRRLDAEYRFNLTEEEIAIIAKQAEDAEQLIKPLFEVDLTGILPLMKVEHRRAPEREKKRRRNAVRRSG
jgi:Asp-tRNA(Asn)/Glu-tRNA(Gln) amidotransferase C subunit